ncbi:MAG: DUF5777 family beta-barrel protein [Ilumatobacteraceae bacterium]
MHAAIVSAVVAAALVVSSGTALAGASGPQGPAPASDPPGTGAGPAGAAGAAGTAEAQDDDPDLDVNRAQPDFTLVGLPTSLRLPARRSAFRITHRFGRPLGAGDFSDLVEDFFGFDSGATIGFEYRYGLLKATQIAVHRTNDRTIQFMLEREIAGQTEDFPVGISALASVEGTNNFKDSYSPGLGLIVSREFSDRGAVYVEPIWMNNTNPLPSDLADDNDAFLVGLGARIRLTANVYGVMELTPRVAGYDPGKTQVAFGVEKRAGGHSFQINVGNGFGTTFGQIARGGTDDWYLGFNISRKFY